MKLLEPKAEATSLIHLRVPKRYAREWVELWGKADAIGDREATIVKLIGNVLKQLRADLDEAEKQTNDKTVTTLN